MFNLAAGAGRGWEASGVFGAAEELVTGFKQICIPIYICSSGPELEKQAYSSTGAEFGPRGCWLPPLSPAM